MRRAVGLVCLLLALTSISGYAAVISFDGFGVESDSGLGQAYLRSCEEITLEVTFVEFDPS